MVRNHGAFHIITGLLLSLFIISLSVTLALNFRFIYYADIERYDLTAVSGLTEDELKQDYEVLIRYNSPWGTGRLDFANFTMSDGGRQHFAEARSIFLFFAWGVIMFGIPAAAGIILSRKKKYGTKYLFYASFITIAVPSALGIFALAAWDRLFVLFHELSFGNDLWIFDPATDPVINVLPDEFFMHEAFAIFGMVIVSGLACLIIWLYTRNSSKDKSGAGER